MWINAGHALKNWSDDSVGESMPMPIVKLTIIYAGNFIGSISNHLHLFRSIKISDYHKEINHINLKGGLMKSC